LSANVPQDSTPFVRPTVTPTPTLISGVDTCRVVAHKGVEIRYSQLRANSHFPSIHKVVDNRPNVGHAGVTMNTIKVAVYGRVSTDKQETDNQLRVLREYCAAAGHQIVAEYVDAGITGSGKVKRPAFVSMMEAARKREFDLLLFWSLDRLSREGALATLQHLKKLDGYGVAWRSHTEAYFDSLGPFRDAVIAIIGTIAAMERSKISERTRAGLQRTKARGTVLGRRKDDEAYAAVIAAHRERPNVSVRELARQAGVSRTTVARALADSYNHATA
jgi:DNA invertase Pin-like site-specific DNA recombinase